MRMPTVSLELKRCPAVVVVVGYVDRGFVVAVWPFMLKLSVRCQP